ncbi:MAG: Cytosol aminopeptidase PepA [uncultured Nocardioidaceae bacterium]|uniref:Probable cytosol aminopeptidase n=1 Tax=uncultured Nocardioidaceae bacterium TaxID=253824 RepID=A0A6J4LXL9_9ACTN|nr:MAG: Cytosol aminopeptidase PepA [uncultured Nocardioidaceae bacterium]
MYAVSEPGEKQPDVGQLGLELPDVVLSAEPPSAVPDAEVVAVPFLKDGDDLLLGPGAAELLDRLSVDLLGLLEVQKATGAAGEVVEHPVIPEPGAPEQSGLQQVLLVGVGESTPSDLRRAGAALARRVRGRERVATSVAALAHDAGLRAFVEGLVLGSFVFTRRTTPPPKAATSFVVAGVGPTESRAGALHRGLATARTGTLSRALAMMPSNEKNPPWLADFARSVARDAGLEVRVWDERQLARDGFGGLVGVGQASATPPRLVQLGYTPPHAGRRTPHVVLVGKGITFDTGGLSVKPADAMTNMKRDMTGAGAVLAAMAALADLECPVRVTGLMTLAENAISGNALRPGDVVRHYGGRTTEVTNTDAEGRLVLADALAYAVAELQPTVVVDIATLTGAIKVALGQRTGGLFATDDALADHLLAAGTAAGEPLWRMPLVDDYEERIESVVADADNAGGPPGALTAALFLRPFAGGVPWAHLDVASAGDSPADSYEWSAGPTGFGARLLLHWLEVRRPLRGVEPPARARRKKG